MRLEFFDFFAARLHLTIKGVAHGLVMDGVYVSTDDKARILF